MAATNFPDRVAIQATGQASVAGIKGGGPRRGNVPLGVGLLIASFAMLYLSLVVIERGWFKIVLGLAALWVFFQGLDRVMKGIKGDNFDTGLYMSGLWIIIVVGGALLADLLPLGEYQDTTKTLSIPGNEHPDLFSAHPFGTNNFSLDILARCIYGARVSLLTAAFAVTISLVVGGTVGHGRRLFPWRRRRSVRCGHRRHAVVSCAYLADRHHDRSGPARRDPEAIWKVAFGLAFVGFPTMSRLARANTLVFAQREFVLSARSMGARSCRESSFGRSCPTWRCRCCPMHSS